MFDFAAMNGANALVGLLGGKGLTPGGGGPMLGQNGFGGDMPTWAGITGGYQTGGLGMGGGIGNAQQFPGGMFGGFGQQMSGFGQSRFPQYGGNTRSAQMMNNYMGGLLSRRQGYQPPSMPSRAAPAAAPMAPSYGVTGGGYDQYSPVTGG